MKQIICLLAAATLALSLVACSSTGAFDQTAQDSPKLTPSATVTPTPAAPSATPTAAPTPTPTPTTPAPQPTAIFAPATALADKIMKEKKWTAYKYADKVRDAVAIVLANSTFYTPEQLASKLRKNVNKIKIARKISSWGYNPRSKTVSLDTATGTVEALTYVLTSCISGNSEYQKYPWGKIKGVPWCFGSNKSFHLGKRESNFRLMSGLTDFISSRNTPDATVSNAGCDFNGKIVMLQYYMDGNRGLPSEQGLSILFYYATGSREAEKAFFGSKKESEAYRADFAKRFGAKKLKTLIAMVDEISLYHGYTFGMSAKRQDNGLARIKAYEDALLGLLETRLAGVKTQTDLDQFLYDLGQFDKFNLSIDDESYMKSISDRIGKIKETAKSKTIS